MSVMEKSNVLSFVMNSTGSFSLFLSGSCLALTSLPPKNIKSFKMFCQWVFSM